MGYQYCFFVNFCEIKVCPKTRAYFALKLGWLKTIAGTIIGPQNDMYLSALGDLPQLPSTLVSIFFGTNDDPFYVPYFRRIIHQKAQVSSLEACYSNLKSQTIVLLSKYIEVFSIVFTKLLLEDNLDIRLSNNCEAASEPLLAKVAHCVPVLTSRYTGKYAARVLKRSGFI